MLTFGFAIRSEKQLLFFYFDMAVNAVKTMGVTEFKARCLRVIGQMNKDREPVTITNRGRRVAVLSPLPVTNEQSSIIGAMRGSVLAYDDPFRPALDPSDWAAGR